MATEQFLLTAMVVVLAAGTGVVYALAIGQLRWPTWQVLRANGALAISFLALLHRNLSGNATACRPALERS